MGFPWPCAARQCGGLFCMWELVMDALIVALVKRLSALIVGKPFFAAVLAAVERFDGAMDLDGDGKKSAVMDELLGAGLIFGRRQFNRAVEWALVIVERQR